MCNHLCVIVYIYACMHEERQGDGHTQTSRGTCKAMLRQRRRMLSFKLALLFNSMFPKHKLSPLNRMAEV